MYTVIVVLLTGGIIVSKPVLHDRPLLVSKSLLKHSVSGGFIESDNAPHFQWCHEISFVVY